MRRNVTRVRGEIPIAVVLSDNVMHRAMGYSQMVGVFLPLHQGKFCCLEGFLQVIAYYHSIEVNKCIAGIVGVNEVYLEFIQQFSNGVFEYRLDFGRGQLQWVIAKVEKQWYFLSLFGYGGCNLGCFREKYFINSLLEEGFDLLCKVSTGK